MSATDELTDMLKARGIEYGWMHRLGIKILWTDANGNTASAINWGDRLLVSALITPRQAVDVTLGAGTCKNTQSDFDFMCSECKKCVDNGRVLGFNYCPNCGRRIEEDE